MVKIYFNEKLLQLRKRDLIVEMDSILNTKKSGFLLLRSRVGVEVGK